MKLTVKTLKGGKFTVDAEPSNTVAEVKGIIEASNSELPAANMKLIHSGKVLKDTDSIEACNIKPNDFLVVMITKAKKAAAAPAAAPAAAAPKEEAKPASAPSPAAAPAPAASGGASTSTEAAAPAAAAPTPAAPPASAPAAADEFPAEVISNLTGMGFPEAEVRACLRASKGNPDVAVEFLMNGIPPGIPTGGEQAAAPSSGSGSPLEALRSHPQFDALRRLVQTNPQTLQAVLNQIGQQQPELLRAINENQSEFVRMMNEPITEPSTPAPAPSSTPSTSTPAPAPSSESSGSGPAGMPPGLLAGMSNPAQMAQMIQNMSPNELQQMAQMMGLTPEQLTATAQMIGQMPPEQFQEYMNMAMQGGGMGGLPGMMGGAGGPGGEGGQPHVLRLSPEEIAAVDRLTDMGFDRAEAAQAYLACDKNEALAANLLMDGGFGFGGDDMGGSGGGGGAGGSGNGDDGDDMYD